MSSVSSRYLKLITQTLLLARSLKSSGKIPFGILSVYELLLWIEVDSNHKLKALSEKLPTFVILYVVELRALNVVASKSFPLNSLKA